MKHRKEVHPQMQNLVQGLPPNITNCFNHHIPVNNPSSDDFEKEVMENTVIEKLPVDDSRNLLILMDQSSDDSEDSSVSKQFSDYCEEDSDVHQHVACDPQEEDIDDPEKKFLGVVIVLNILTFINLLFIIFLAYREIQMIRLDKRIREACNRVGDIYHREASFSRDYAAMERDFKVFVYPGGNATTCYHSIDHKLKSKYASEHYFFMNLRDSRFLTNDPREAHLFFIPISCLDMKAKVIKNMEKDIENYVQGLISIYPYWNRTLGADHFFVSCHDIGSRATEKVPFLLKNAIRLMCSPSYDSKYIPHKDISLPQILELSVPPHHGYDMWNRSIAESPLYLLPPEMKHPPRTRLAFWAGSINSEVRRNLWFFCEGVQDFEIHLVGQMKRSTVLRAYESELYGSKFCICPRGKTQVGGVCLAESMTFGCVPVILSDNYDLPFNDVVDRNTFSVILKEDRVRHLEKILRGIPEETYKKMHQNLLQVRKHFKWNSPPVQYDEFHMVMYELWQRRHVSRFDIKGHHPEPQRQATFQ